MNILFLSPDFAPHFYGGGGVFASNLVNELREQGNRVDVVSTNLLSDKVFIKENIDNSSNYFLQPIFYKILSIFYSRLKSLKIYSFYSPESVNQLIKNLDPETKYDLIQMFAFPGHFGQDQLVLKIKKLYPDSPVVLYSHALPGIFNKTWVNKLIYKLYWVFLASKVNKLSNLILVNSDSTLDGLPVAVTLNKKSEVLTPGVKIAQELQTDDELLSKYDIKDSDVVLVSVGTITWHKNQEKTLKIFGELCKLNEKTNYKLIFIGQINQQELYDNLINLVKEMGLDSQVIFTGFIYDTAKQQLIQRSDIIISSSQKEGFGMTLVEGMSYGKLVYVSNVEGHKDIIKEGVNGYFYPDGDETEIAKKLNRKIHLKEVLEVRENAVKFAKTMSWNNIALNYIKICNNYLKHKYD